MPGEIAAKIETALKNGNLNMSDLHAACDSILKENGIADKMCSRKTLKQMIQNNVAGVEFHKPKRVNESERVSIEETRDVAIQLSEDVKDMRDDMNTLYDPALLLRKAINKSKKWVFDGSLETFSMDSPGN